MSGRVSKAKHPKTTEAGSLAEYIQKNGDLIMPCSRCFRLKLPCQAKEEKSNRCGNCVDAKVVCDGAGVATFREFFVFVCCSDADFFFFQLPKT